MMAPSRAALLILPMVGWLVGVGPAIADSCWDTRGVDKDENYPVSNLFGALPAEVARCEQVGSQLIKDLDTIRADPSLLEKEKQTGYVYYKSRWDCCKNWVGYRCQHYPPPESQAGTYGSTRLEGKLSGLCDKGVESKPKRYMPTTIPDPNAVVKKPKFDVH
jgi:hypothetical protein